MKQLVLNLQVLTTVDIRYFKLSLCRTIYLVLSAFLLTSFINPFGISNSAISNFHYVQQFSRSFESIFFVVFYLLSWTFKWSFRTNHAVHFRHSNVNNCIVKTLFGSLFFLFFNIVQATTCPQLSEISVLRV